jgi:hypothetical protein
MRETHFATHIIIIRIITSTQRTLCMPLLYYVIYIFLLSFVRSSIIFFSGNYAKI